MSKMSRQERLAYEQALKKRKKQGSSTKKRNSSSSRNTTRTSGRRSRSRYTDYDGNEIDENDIRNRRSSRYIDYDSYDRSRGYDTYDDYDDYDSYGYDDYNDYDDDDYEYEERPRRTRMPEDLGFGTRKRRSSSSGYRGREPGPAGGRHTKRLHGRLIFLIQMIATAVFLGTAVYFGMIPWTFLGGAAVVLLVLALLIFRMQNGFRKKRFLGGILGLLISALLLLASYYMFEVRTALNDITDGNEAPDRKEAAAAVNVSEEPFSVYISGIDVYGDITQQSRSDVNIIATVNPKTKQILLVTTPRDYYVPDRKSVV